MKNIKDYLHLYLGCECMMTKNSYHAVHELHLSAELAFKLNGRLLQYFIEPTTRAELKLILRPLSDMTEEEGRYVVNNTYLRDATLGRTEKDFAISLTERWIKNGQVFVYLLSKQFDLFDLIESGAALNKTLFSETIKQKI